MQVAARHVPGSQDRSRLTRLAGELLAADIAPGALQIARDSAAGELAGTRGLFIGACRLLRAPDGTSVGGQLRVSTQGFGAIPCRTC